MYILLIALTLTEMAWTQMLFIIHINSTCINSSTHSDQNVNRMRSLRMCFGYTLIPELVTKRK